MKPESEIREVVMDLDDLIACVRDVGIKSLVQKANLEAFKNILLWVLDEDQSMGDLTPKEG